MAVRLASALLLALAALPASASDIATWTDDHGVTHFGNAQFGPAGAHRVEVPPANGMDVPQAPPAARAHSGPAIVVLEKKANRETIGFRGHDWTVRQSPRRGHR